jgi:hypothetical protein
MTDTHTLTRHKDIQNWVADHKGMPAIARIRNRFGIERAKLTINFASPDRRKSDRAHLDDGVSPCSWAAWLAELDRQQLALQVDADADDYALVERKDTH